MVIYFSKGGSTRRYAQALAEAKGEKIFEIKQADKMDNVIMQALKSVAKKEDKIASMPDVSAESVIYLCCPVWGGGFPSPMRYFVRHADLKGKTVKLLLTCMTASNSYVGEFEKQLIEVGAKLDKSVVFSSAKNPEPNKEELVTF